ncbi:MAG: dynamin family protein [Hyphomicrobiales bacterium]|nr:dynamin family protein [Hyphomicrobiales bacterium]
METFDSLIDAKITSRLGDVKRRGIDLGEELQATLHSRLGRFVSSMLSEIESHSCRIAVIGQIKAGKSSLINALIRRPGLLPTDINPSTAVITKLYFGAPAERNNTALFEFFGEQEWDRIMSGGRAGAMTMHREAAVNSEKLTGALEELRERAEERLGAEYGSLFGKHHLFSSVTSSLLERYVSAGDNLSGACGSDADRRHFSDITKNAEVFLEGQPLGYPSVVIDTPGVNDPFLVRDEITHGNLGDADIYLVVLTAQQPLSKSDLALLRMLKGLQKDRIIAVVNRVDLLDMENCEAEKLASHVRNSLRREFPHSDIPVILVSARWAQISLNGKPDALRQTLNTSFAAYSRYKAECGEPSFDTPDESWSDAEISQMLYRASGIPAVLAGISRLIGHSVTAEQLLPLASTLGAISDNTVISTRYSIRSLNDAAAASERWTKSRVNENLTQIENLLAEVEGTLAKCKEDFRRLSTEEIGRLRKFMLHTVEKFAEDQRVNLLRYEAYAAYRAHFQEQSFQLRSQLAEDFYKYITEISKQFLARQREAENVLRQAVKHTLPDLDDVLHFGIQSANLPPPSIMPLSKVTAVDIDGFWDAKAAITKVDPAEASQFKQIVFNAFGEVIAELFEMTEHSQNGHVSNALRRLRFLSYSAIYPLAQQLQDLVSARKDMEGLAQGGQGWGTPFFWEPFLQECQQQLARIEKVAREAVEIRQECIRLISS